MATKRTKKKSRAGGRKSPKRVQAGRKAARTRKIKDTVTSLRKTSPGAARREVEKIMSRARIGNSLFTRMAKTARKAADAVVGTGASLYESVTK